MTRVLREIRLSEPVSNWLKSHGCVVYADVPFGGYQIDLVGRGGDTLIGVQLKMCCSTQALRQAMIDQMWCDYAFVACGTRPRATSVDRAKLYGLGLLTVCGGDCRLVLEPCRKLRQCLPEYHERLIQCLDRIEPGGVGGFPTLKGVGPAMECARCVAVYRRENPRASWREVYQAVPNHYASPTSMASALRRLIPDKEVS